MSKREPRPIDTVLDGPVTWTYDREKDKLSRAEWTSKLDPLAMLRGEIGRITGGSPKQV